MKSDFFHYLQKTVLVKPEHLPKLIELLSSKEIKKGEVLLSEGQICKPAFFIEKGLVRLYSIDISYKG